jgi:hypothetical protein
MADRASEIRYVREKANQFRVLAKTYEGQVSLMLLQIAEELGVRADALERRFKAH